MNASSKALGGHEIATVQTTAIDNEAGLIENEPKVGSNNVRAVSRLENEAVLDRMAERLKARPEIVARRREIVEHPFGSIKQWIYQGAFLMRGFQNARAEFSLTALAYNLRRALNILGVTAMTAAVAA